MKFKDEIDILWKFYKSLCDIECFGSAFHYFVQYICNMISNYISKENPLI